MEMEEKRRYIRWKVPANAYEKWDIPTKVKYKIEHAGVGKEALCRDISMMGMKLSLSEGVREGTVLEMKIDIPGEKEPILVRGEVAWQREVGKEKKRYFEAGIYFIGIKDADKAKIYAFVYEWGPDEVRGRWWKGVGLLNICLTMGNFGCYNKFRFIKNYKSVYEDLMRRPL